MGGLIPNTQSPTRNTPSRKCSDLPLYPFYGIHSPMLLEEEVVQLRGENAELRQLVAQLQAELGQARTRIAELEQQRTDPPPFVKPNRPTSTEPKAKRKKR